jgi:hypothetical protein
MHIPAEAQAILRRMRRRGYVCQAITAHRGYVIEVWKRGWMVASRISAVSKTALAACREVERQWKARKNQKGK